ncbi:hypothetical protein CHLRE_11g467706v5 [Chlamydomonas reinhardtii]|uniref:histone deacetylase n=1 Tax=Chlamydomonas reinhardtii TaxID=3055 RepID=A0A2K3D7S0_CHLRE|nr:uncharacterized protein CHLRE_11g467706v5 [Chlamydomonas reinhardtii]PNW76576.1 hypothetical protein CHLRE_11g467706v5 [Chlamydomonas reinhardtii]
MPQAEALSLEMQRLSVSAPTEAQQASSSTTADEPFSPGVSAAAATGAVAPPPPQTQPLNGVQLAFSHSPTTPAPTPPSASPAAAGSNAADECGAQAQPQAQVPAAVPTPAQGQEQAPGQGERAGPRHVLAPSSPAPGDTRVGLLYDNSMERHVGPEHYERPARIIAVHQVLQEQELWGRCWQLVPRQATDTELLLGHTEEHIRKVDSLFDDAYPARPESLAGASYCFAEPAGAEKGDVYVCSDTPSAARMATGCCVEAVKQVLGGTVSRALAIVRPPGHHAECERAQGFCFFNNVAVAALAALQHPDVKRVAVLDWDIHHGNGIQNILLQRPDALYLSLHRDPKRFYPFTSGFVGEAGEGPGLGFNVNVPWLKKGMGDGDYMAAFSLVVEPVLQSYAPDLVIVAAGFDAADGDPLGGCKVSPEGYGWMTERLLQFAGGKVVLALEGGYNNRVTAWCAAACVRALLEGAASPGLPRDKEHLWPAESHDSLKRVYEVQRQHWAPLRERSWSDAWEAHLKEVVLLLGSNSRSKRGSAAGGGAAAPPSLPGATAAATSSSGTGGGGGGGGRRASGSEGATSGRRRSGSAGGGSSASGAAPAAPAAAAADDATATPQSLADAFKARRAARTSGAGKAAAAATAAAPAATPAVARPPAAGRKSSGVAQAGAEVEAAQASASAAGVGGREGEGEGQAGRGAAAAASSSAEMVGPEASTSELAAAAGAAGQGDTAESAGPGQGVGAELPLADEVLPNESGLVQQCLGSGGGAQAGGGGGASGGGGGSGLGVGTVAVGAAAMGGGGVGAFGGVPLAVASMVAVGGEA